MKNFRTTRQQQDKIQSAMDNSRDSRNSSTGYVNRGNSAMVQQKARALRNNDNGSHW